MTPHQQRLVRSLSILRRLQVGAADRQTLIDHVQSECGPFAYEAESAKAVESRLAHDIKFLRENLLVNIPSVDRSTNTYEIADFGDFRPLCLTDTELDALMTLLQSFQSGAPHSEAVAGFLVRIADLLPTAQQQVLTTRQARLRMELRYRDTETIAPAVQRAIDKAIRERRHLQFAYRTASQQDDQSRVHEVQPDHQYFDPSRGHLYLNAYWLTSDGPVGKHKQERWQSFRLDRILADEHLRVLSQKVPPLRPRRPHHQLEYWLSPQIARLGQVTRHFEEMAVHETNDAGWVRITGTTDDLFQATRFLLSYGPNCRVTGGADAKREMEKLIREMATVYGFLPTE
ncbi:MAG: WYL domain-containing protein [Caldilineaceae bacterium]|nr:WYL domain-containing protein [Caldilineaceae bacterium]